MKNILRMLLLLSLSTGVILTGCSVRVYGVPKEDWQRMTPAEQQEARAAYQERMRLYEERRLYEAKQRAHEAELKAQKAREEASHPAPQRQAYAPSLIHFTLEGGTIYIAGRHHSFLPVTVELRDGESKHLQLITADERKPHHVQLVCRYEEGVLRLSNGNSRIHAQQFSFDSQWNHGRRYKNLTLGGGVGLRGGVMRVGSGAMPVKSSPRWYTNNGHSENPNTREKNRDIADQSGRQQQMPAVSSGKHQPMNNGKAPIATEKPRGIESAIGTSVSALTKEKMDNGHKEEARNQDQAVANNRGQTHKPGQGNQSQAVANNRGETHKPSQGNQGQAKNQKPQKSPESKGKNDPAQPQEEISSPGENPKDEENQACGEAQANKNKRTDCGNKPVVSKFTAKGRQD